MSVINNFKTAHDAVTLPIPRRNGKELKFSCLWAQDWGVVKGEAANVLTI